MKNKNIILFRIPISCSDTKPVLEEVREKFGKSNEEQYRLSAFLSKGESGNSCLAVRIEATSMRLAQVKAAPLMKYLSLLEVGMELVQDKKADSYEVTEDELVLKTITGGLLKTKKLSFQEIFER